MYYSGTEDQWNEIAIDEYNDPLDNVTFHYTSFTDVTYDASSSWYYPAMIWVKEDGFITGYGNDYTFAPNASCTRAQVVTMLYLLAGSPSVSNYTSKFPDVPSCTAENDWYYNAMMLWVGANAIVTGKEGGTFAPVDTCTRSEIVALLYRVAGSPDTKGLSNPFTDVTDSTT